MKIDSITINTEKMKEMEIHVERCLPEEGCGLLAGINGFVKAVLPVTNQAHSPVRFFMEPLELLHALEWIEKKEYDLIGIFHSHPKGPETPSETDIREFNYPGASVIILSNNHSKWKLRAFMIENSSIKEIGLLIKKNS